MAKMKFRDRLISNTSYLFLNWFSVNLVAMFYWILVGKNLSTSSYGTIATATQIATILSYVSMFGLNEAVKKLVPEFIGGNKVKQAYSIIYYNFKIAMISALAFGAGVFLLTGYLSSVFGFENEVFFIVALSVVFASFARFLEQVIYGLQKMKKLFITNAIGEIVKVTTAVVLLWLGFDYFGPLVGFMMSLLIMGLIRLESKFFKFRKLSVNKNLIKKYAYPGFWVILFYMLFESTALIIISTIKGPDAAGLFALAAKIYFVIPLIPSTFTGALFPIMSSLSSKRNTKKRQSYLINLVFRYTVLFTIPIALFFTFFAKYMVLYFSQTEYLEAALILPVLGITGIFFGLGNFFRQNLYALKKPKEYRNTYLIATLVYLALAPVLTYYFSAFGTALTFLIAGIVLAVLTYSRVRKTLKIRLNLRNMTKVIIAALIFSPIVLATVHFFDTSFVYPVFINRISILHFALATVFVILAALVYFIPIFLLLKKMGFYIKEDSITLDSLHEKVPALRRPINLVKRILLE